MAGTGWGTATRDDDGLCVVKIVQTAGLDTEADRFDGATFEEAMRLAADAGKLKSSCLEKQIAFLARSLPDAQAGGDVELPRDSESTSARAEGRLFPTITSLISALVHETQRERGVSSLYVSSGGHVFGAELKQQWAHTDERRAQLAAFRASGPVGFPRTLAFRLERAEDMLATLVDGRDEIVALKRTTAALIDDYTAINLELLGIVDELAGRPVLARSRSAVLAWMALLHAKEKTGLERAQLSTVFMNDHFGDGQHAQLSGLIAARHSYLHLFSVAAPQLARDLMQRMLKSPIEQAVSDMEQIALNRQNGGFGIDPAAWFTTISYKIDSLGEMEAAVRVSLAPNAG